MAFLLLPLGIEFVEGALGAEGFFAIAGGAAESIGIAGIGETIAGGGIVETVAGGGLAETGAVLGTEGLGASVGTDALLDATILEGGGSVLAEGGSGILAEETGTNIVIDTLPNSLVDGEGSTAIADGFLDADNGEIINLDSEIFGSNVVIDDSPEILGLDVLDLTKQGIFDTLRNGLADIGITEELLGATQYNKLMLLASGGSITVDEIVKWYDESNLPDTVDKQISDLSKKKNGISPPNGYLFIDALGNPVDTTQFLNGTIKDVIDPYYIGYASGKLACDIGYEMSKTKNVKMNKNLLLSTLRAVHKDNEYAFIAKKMNKYMGESEYIKDPLKYSNTYNYYYQIYDGKFMKPPYLNENGKVAAIDETGKEYVYTGSLGVHSILGYEVNNPTLHGTWVGPASPNNTIPVDSFDSGAYFHDNDYENGYFHKEADTKLIVRTQHILDDPIEREKYSTVAIAKMKFTVWWFSNIGPMLSSLYDQEHSTSAQSDALHADEGNFFDAVLGQYDKRNQKQNLDLPEEYFWIRRKARSFAEKQFMAGLEEGVNQQYKYYSELYLVQQAKKKLDNIPIYGIN